MTNDKIPSTTRKTRSRTQKTPSSDLFTALVESNIGAKCVMEYQFHPTRKWRFDYALPQYRIALEVEGGVFSQGRHTRPQGFLGDMEKYNTATLMGWRLLRTTPSALITNETLSLLRMAVNNTYPTNFTQKRKKR